LSKRHKRADSSGTAPDALPEEVRLRVFNLSVAAIGAQAGCTTLVIVFCALFLGLWLDSLFDQRGPCTFGLLILSIPVSLTAMLRVTLRAIERLQRDSGRD
jgi:hypothetical protein